MWFEFLVLIFGFSRVLGVVDYKAVAVINNPPVKGVLTFYQTNAEAPIEIRGDFSGLTPGKHDLFIHTYGDLSRRCESTGDQWNPFNAEHGGPGSGELHVGNLGKLRANRRGKASISLTTQYFSLVGSNPTSILGRSVVIYATPDDLDLNETGYSEDRIACAAIGIARNYQDIPRGHYVPGFVNTDNIH